jgi:hypothetical protein
MQWNFAYYWGKLVILRVQAATEMKPSFIIKQVEFWAFFSIMRLLTTDTTMSPAKKAKSFHCVSQVLCYKQAYRKVQTVVSRHFVKHIKNCYVH